MPVYATTDDDTEIDAATCRRLFPPATTSSRRLRRRTGQRCRRRFRGIEERPRIQRVSGMGIPHINLPAEPADGNRSSTSWFAHPTDSRRYRRPVARNDGR
jgi:hypothetical protein